MNKSFILGLSLSILECLTSLAHGEESSSFNIYSLPTYSYTLSSSRDGLYIKQQREFTGRLWLYSSNLALATRLHAGLVAVPTFKAWVGLIRIEY